MKPSPRKIAVCVKQAADVTPLVGLATRLENGRRPEITVLHVVEVPPALPLDARAKALEAPALKVEQAIRQTANRNRGVRLSTRILRARDTGRAVLDELKQGKFDLAVLGYHHKRSLSELLLGTTAQYLAKHAPCRLLMSIPLKR